MWKWRILLALYNYTIILQGLASVMKDWQYLSLTALLNESVTSRVLSSETQTSCCRTRLCVHPGRFANRVCISIHGKHFWLFWAKQCRRGWYNTWYWDTTTAAGGSRQKKATKLKRSQRSAERQTTAVEGPTCNRSAIDEQRRWNEMASWIASTLVVYPMHRYIAKDSRNNQMTCTGSYRLDVLYQIDAYS